MPNLEASGVERAGRRLLCGRMRRTRHGTGSRPRLSFGNCAAGQHHALRRGTLMAYLLITLPEGLPRTVDSQLRGLGSNGEISRVTPNWRTTGWVSREELQFDTPWTPPRDLEPFHPGQRDQNGVSRQRAIRTSISENIFTRSINWTASHRTLAWEGYLPGLTLGRSRTSSSIPIYERRSPMEQVTLRRLF